MCQRKTYIMANNEENEAFNDPKTTRRCILERGRNFAAASIMGASTLPLMNPVTAAWAIEQKDASSSTSISPSLTISSPSDAVVTDKIFFNVRISRSDGTFYVRDEQPDDKPEDKVWTGRLVLGLFGEAAPNHVKHFKQYITSMQDLLDDNPLPSYGRSRFVSFDEATGVITGGEIPSLEVTNLSGSTALQYGGRLIPATLWLEKRSPDTGTVLPRISHTEKGLLTHKSLDVTPVFGITTRKDTTQLDSIQTVFGRILDDESSRQFLEIVQHLPTYSTERPVSENSENNAVVEDAARAVFSAQKGFFRNAAKTFGDTRLDKVYDGKLLRRVEVTQVGIL